MFFRISLTFIFLAFTSCVSTSTHEELKTKHNESLSELKISQLKIDELETLIAQLERDLGKASRNKKSMANSIQHMKEALKKESLRKAEAEKRLNEFRKLLSRFKSLTDMGQLSIQIKEGRMVVVLPSDVLFRSGSTQLSEQGKDTIQKVAQVLASIPNKQYQIEGHTDNVPIAKKYRSNWELASSRALTVLHLMTQAGMPQHRISAASFGETKPLSTNDTKEGKALNRRIDIVVLPDLSQLPGYDELQKMSAQ